MAKKNSINKPKDYNFQKAILQERLHRDDIKTRDKKSRKFMDGCPEVGHGKLKIGGVYCFDYFDPITKEDLDYYDARPVTIFFGRGKNKEGKMRVIGFNWHYLPPRMRYKFVAKLLELFREYDKYWVTGVTRDIPKMYYKRIVEALKRAKLEFCVRMYDPRLMRNIKEIPGEGWQKAVFSEGHFKKQDREKIMNHWKNL